MSNAMNKTDILPINININMQVRISSDEGREVQTIELNMIGPSGSKSATIQNLTKSFEIISQEEVTAVINRAITEFRADQVRWFARESEKG